MKATTKRYSAKYNYFLCVAYRILVLQTVEEEEEWHRGQGPDPHSPPRNHSMYDDDTEPENNNAMMVCSSSIHSSIHPLSGTIR
jgi:hypothetical protein